MDRASLQLTLAGVPDPAAQLVQLQVAIFSRHAGAVLPVEITEAGSTVPAPTDAAIRVITNIVDGPAELGDAGLADLGPF